METVNNQARVCPKCGETYNRSPAISREDNTTPICPICGTREALASLGISEEEQEKIISLIRQVEPQKG